jgi:Ca2+-binding RTX toxin-like protein
VIAGKQIVTASRLSADALSSSATAAVKGIETIRLQSVNLNGTAGADRLSADGTHNMKIDGGAGDDILTGGGIGHNTLIGGAGDDTFYVKSSNDSVVEGANGGIDTVVSTVDVTLSDNVENLRMMTGATYGAGNSLDNKITGTAVGDTILGMEGHDSVQGLEGNDKIYGGNGNDVLVGGAGNDTLAGDAGADKLTGSEGNDSLQGGAGADTLEGGVGADTLSGGVGADVFFFRDGDTSLSTPDRVIDFNAAEGDKISLSMIDAVTTVAGDQKFLFIGTSAFHKVAGEMRYESLGGQSTVFFDTNGDGIADLKLLVGAGTLQASDFIL